MANAWVRDLRARVRPGHAVVLLDVSALGALIEGQRPLQPGGRVDVQVSEGERQAALRATVLRCRVAAIDPDAGVTYQSALSFEEPLRLVSEACARYGHELPGTDCELRSNPGQPLPAAAVVLDDTVRESVK